MLVISPLLFTISASATDLILSTNVHILRFAVIQNSSRMYVGLRAVLTVHLRQGTSQFDASRSSFSLVRVLDHHITLSTDFSGVILPMEEDARKLLYRNPRRGYELIRPNAMQSVSLPLMNRFYVRQLFATSPGQNATGQNATGQNATNSGICFYFLLMLFQFLALPFNMSQPMVISAYHKLCFAHTTLITGTPRHGHWTLKKMASVDCKASTIELTGM